MAGFDAFLARGDKVLGLDTETTNLNVYAPGFAVRLVQLGNDREAWVLRADRFRDHIVRALRQPRRFTVHNASFDLQVIDRALGVPIEDLAPRTFDTRILAHLLDPRQRHEGGTGLALKELSEVYVDPSAPDTQAGLHEVFRRDYRATKETGWSVIDVDHPTYVRYAGLDPILARRLFDELLPLVRDVGLDRLSVFEHRLQALLAMMQRRGVLLDVPYIQDLKGRLGDEADHYRQAAARYGVANVNSTAQIAEALTAMGEDLTERTPSGALKVDKGVLLPLADLDTQWQRIEARTPNPLADAVLRAKRADKWSTSYAQAFLDLRDDRDRLHPMIGALQARTARMSISNPPLQQLPSSDWTIRRGVIADPGQVIVAADYQAVEMRVLAALSGDERMIQAILDGEDLHSFTARMVYGPEFTKAHRKISKAVGFGKVFGGGAATIQRQTGADLEAVRTALRGYDETFPGIRRFAQRLQNRADYGKREVVTPTGRHLPLDRDRLYAATNYIVQSTSRDLLAQAIVDIHEAGLGEHLLLPVHDELIAQAPADVAEDVIQEIGRLMESTFGGVPIVSEPEVYGRSWGSGYGCPPEADAA
ncbi:DNA polymerase [Nocardioides ochotonae]|uniref:DNA polymerase n=1 Tax=Nocardioides ochotonae TaxID=2685869 RepID=UPI001CD44AD8|nr:DNA polymerase [Nocardioides ochotonae]